MKRIDLINYIILIGLILFFVLLVLSYYSNEPVVEGLTALETAQDELNKLIQRKQQLETESQILYDDLLKAQANEMSE